MNKIRRFWIIDVADNQRIKLDWLFLDVEYDQQCKRDSVIIKKSRRSRTFASYCGDELPPVYLSSHNEVIVEFQSDEKNVGTGFKLHYQAISGNIIRMHRSNNQFKK